MSSSRRNQRLYDSDDGNVYSLNSSQSIYREPIHMQVSHTNSHYIQLEIFSVANVLIDRAISILQTALNNLQQVF